MLRNHLRVISKKCRDIKAFQSLPKKRAEKSTHLAAADSTVNELYVTLI